MKVKTIDIKGGDLDILYDGQLVLHIGQVFDDECGDLYFYPQDGSVIEEHEKVDVDDMCTHQMLVVVKKK